MRYDFQEKTIVLSFLSFHFLITICELPESISFNKILLFLFIAVFAKFLFTGAEFITSAAVMSVCPFIYYSILDRNTLKEGFISFLKASAVTIAAVIAGFVFLIIQIKAYDGTWQAGIDHIVFSFTKRTANNLSLEGNSTLDIVRMYFVDSSIVSWKFLPQFTVSFGALCLFTLALIVVICKTTTEKFSARNRALVITTIISIAGPLSWIIIFKQHAYTHLPFDYITWYMPFCFFAFTVIGLGINLLFQHITKRRIET